MLNEPLRCGLGRRIEAGDVGIEVTAREGDEPFRSQGTLECSEGPIGDCKVVTERDNQGESEHVVRQTEIGWQSVQPCPEMTVDGTRLVLCHYPFRTWRDMGRGSVNLHGHSHGRLKPLRCQFDVDVDVWDVRPVPLEQVLSDTRAAER